VTCRKKRTCRGTLTLRRGRTVLAKRKVRVRRTKMLRIKLAPQATTSVARRKARLTAKLRGARVTVR
jgi:hypothetical protein